MEWSSVRKRALLRSLRLWREHCLLIFAERARNGGLGFM